MGNEVSKKFGGQTRADKARTEMSKIFSDPNHELYLEKDIDLAHRFDVSRLTIYNIREQLRIPPRTDRILSKLKSVDTKQYTKRQLSTLLGLKYQNLYKIIREYKIKVKPDTRPIESMIKFQKSQKSKRITQNNIEIPIKKLKEEEKVAKKAKEEKVVAPAKEEAAKPAKKVAKEPVKAKPAKKAAKEVPVVTPAKEPVKNAAKPAKKVAKEAAKEPAKKASTKKSK
jgi:hypothetical protein